MSGYQHWIKTVDYWVAHISGLSVTDLADYEYRDCFEGGEAARDVADAVLAENGYCYEEPV